MRRRRRPDLEALEERQLLSVIQVTNTGDSNVIGSGSLRAAILQANADSQPDDILFNIPASTAPNLDVPVPGFDPVTQDWTITPLTPLPTITNTVSIDGYTQAQGGGVPFRYPSAISSAIQSISITGSPAGGTFTLTSSIPGHSGTTGPIVYNANAASVQAALIPILGPTNFVVAGGPGPGTPFTITFQNALGHQAVADLTGDGSALSGGTNSIVLVQTTAVGGIAVSDPIFVRSVPNSVVAKQGDNAKARVIIDGHLTGGGTGFVVDASHSALRGLIISRFGIGVEVPKLDPSLNANTGDLIQGNFIGDYFVYLVDTQTGSPLPNPVGFTQGQGNSRQGVMLESTNTTLGGSNPQENNVICGNGQQGVLFQPGASGNQLLGNQIGMAGPSSNGLYAQDGNGAEGVLILSSGVMSNPLSIVYSSSNFIGGATPDSGNLISGNTLTGVRLVGVGANRNLIQSNYIGVGPGGGFLFGTENPGNGDDGNGIRVEDGSLNVIGGSTRGLGNVIASNHGAGVYIVGSAPTVVSGVPIPASATGNSVANNMIGLTAGGSQVLGNSGEGVALYARNNTIGPGNVISANLRGVGIYGPTGTLNLVKDNFIGTDAAGVLAGFGNAAEGILINNSPANTIQGNAAGSQVISGNQVGVAIVGVDSTQNLVLGSLIGTNFTGTADLGNKAEGVLISGAGSNTVGGDSAAALNLISANHWGVRLDGVGATGNQIEGNYIGTDITGLLTVGNEVIGVITSNSANHNSIGGITADLGNKIWFQRDGVSVQSGTGNSILSNSIFRNYRIGIDLVALGDPPSGVTPNQPVSPVPSGPNQLQNYPVLTDVTYNGSLTHIQGTLNSVPNSTFLIQFFTSAIAGPNGYGEGDTRFGQTPLPTPGLVPVKTDSNGHAVINIFLARLLPPGVFMTATATNLTTGDTSEFSAYLSQEPAMQFTASTFTVDETVANGVAEITLSRTFGAGQSMVQYSTVPGGTAIAGQDYVAISNILIFPAGILTASFTVPILDDHLNENTTETVNLVLASVPNGNGIADFQTTATLNIVDNDLGTANLFIVTNTQDSGPGSLRQAILDANAHSGTDDIQFAIPASLDPNLNVPVNGFDPATQTWKISLQSALPTITDQVNIDGYSQGQFPIPYRYANAVNTEQIINVTGNPTGGSFSLSTVKDGTTPAFSTGELAFDETASGLGLALIGVFGFGNTTVSGGPANVAPFVITFIGADQGKVIPPLVATNNLSGGIDPSVTITTAFKLGDPTPIVSTPNTAAARDGNDAHIAVIVDGSQIPGGAPGFVIDTNDSILRGLIIDGFTTGVSVPHPYDRGNRIEGNFIGSYFLYPVDASSGTPLPTPFNVKIIVQGNSWQGVYIDGNNTTLGGFNPDENNVIAGNGLEGVRIDVDGNGNVVEGNQIGMIGPSSNGRYAQLGNGREGVLVLGSSNAIGGPGGGTGNLISGNALDGVHIQGPIATRNVIGANIIGLGPGGGYRLGTGNPGNGRNGVWIQNSTQNQVGGPNQAWGNVISSNAVGILVDGITSSLNIMQNNLIGLTADGKAVKGNTGDGVSILSTQNTIGPGNVISGNLRGIRISGANASKDTVLDNLIGTDITGEFDLGNALEGIRIENAADAVIQGDGKGSQVISGNHQGIVIAGPTSTRNLVQGNLIGSDKTGLAPIPNAYEGIAVLGAPKNTIGGTTASDQNLISANHWGVRLDGAAATGNLVQGNLIGPDITGKVQLGNEINGVIVSNNASSNTIGGTAAGAGNTIAFNILAGVLVESGTGNSILTNSIFSNGKLGIDLVAPGDPASGVTPNQPGVRSGPNDLQNYPVLTTAVGGGPTSGVQGTLNSLPGTSFLIQFFTSQIPDPSGFGQGQNPNGSMVVTTDAQGNALILFTPTTNLAANTWITATATNQATGDTSEFSNAISALPVSVQFLTATYTVQATDGTALIDVHRSGNLNAIVSVFYATGNGTGIAGKDYAAASGTLTFQPGQVDKTFGVTILQNASQTAGSVTVNLALGQPTGGATLGSPGTAVLTIINNLPPVIQFSKSNYAAFSTSSNALITLTRGGGDRGASVQVTYATAGGTAVPGVNYTAVQSTITFLPNQLTATFSVPILPGNKVAGTNTVGLVLSDPAAGAQIGALSSATLTITTFGTNPVNPSGPVDTNPPQITGQQLMVGAGGITAVVYSFSKPLNAARAQDLGNYGYYLSSAAPNGSFGTSGSGFVTLAAAQYNPAAMTVTVIPVTPLPYNNFYRIVINSLATTLLNRGIVDLSGNLLSGQSNGVAGGPFVSTFGAGPQLNYTDSLGKTVNLSLAGGGVIEVFRAASGDVQSVSLAGTVPRKSVLSLRANRAGAASTYLPPIQGASGVKFRYRTPPKVFRSSPVLPTSLTHKAKPVKVKRVR